MRKKRAPARPIARALQKNNSPLFSSVIHPEIQAFRTRHLARRHRLAPSTARVVAEFCFREAPR